LTLGPAESKRKILRPERLELLPCCPAGLWDVLHPGWWELIVGDVDKPSDVLQPRLQPGKTQNPPAGYGFLVDTGVDGLHLVASDVKQASDVLGPNPAA